MLRTKGISKGDTLLQLLKCTLVFVRRVGFKLCYDRTECLERKYRQMREQELQTFLQYI
jgi:hypothetical protein